MEHIETKDWKLLDKEGKKVIKGQIFFTHQGDQVRIVGGNPPHKPSSTGRVYVKYSSVQEFSNEYFPGVIGCQWIKKGGMSDKEIEESLAGDFKALDYIGKMDDQEVINTWNAIQAGGLKNADPNELINGVDVGTWIEMIHSEMDDRDLWED